MSEKKRQRRRKDQQSNNTISGKVSNDAIISVLNNTAIKNKILNGSFTVKEKNGRSKVWSTFGYITDATGKEIPNLVVCRTCYGVYKHNTKSTTNLIRHKCYLQAKPINDNENPIELGANTKKDAVEVVTAWIVQNCRPYKVIEDEGIEKFAKFLISVGAKYGENVNIRTLLPHSTTVARNVENIYLKMFAEIKADIAAIKNMGFALTPNLWTDSYLHRSFLALTMHFIKDAKLVNVLLGMRSMDGEKCTSTNVRKKVCNILRDFDCELNEKVTLVTDGGSIMLAAFPKESHIFCINHLLNQVLQKAVADVPVVKELCNSARNLVRYLKKSGINSALATSLKSFCPTRWNTNFYVLSSLKTNWNNIISILQLKNEMERIGHLDVNNISAILEILEPFEETLKKLQGDNYPTIHLIYIYITSLRKKCTVTSDDIDFMSELKNRLLHYLNTVDLENLTDLHKIALFLYPPAKELKSFTDYERRDIKDKCSQLMGNLLENSDSSTDLEFANIALKPAYNLEMFSDLLKQPTFVSCTDKVAPELQRYENMEVYFHVEFDIINWWESHKSEMPLLYKLSRRIIATPASSACYERVFSSARNVISEKRNQLLSNDTALNQLIFVHYNNSSDIKD